MIELIAITNGGERVTHLYPNDCYYAHLSLYRFALQFGRQKSVLDAGSGTGYGSAYLADRGAREVWGIDISADAIAFSQHHFRKPNLRYHVMDVQDPSKLPSHYFDVVFSSNVPEHLPDVPKFLRVMQRVLAPDGALIIAVPPVIHEASRAENIAIPHHLNIWSPRQWYATLGAYFADVQCYRHDFDKPGVALDFTNYPSQTVIDEDDFSFHPVSLDQWLASPSMTFVVAARVARVEAASLRPDELPTAVDDSFTKATVARQMPCAESPVRRWSRAIWMRILPLQSRRRQLWVVACRTIEVCKQAGVAGMTRKASAALRRQRNNYRPA
jgi:SAM-dependent methyltransferase